MTVVSQRLLIREDGSTPRLAFPTATGRAMFFARPHMLPAEMPDDDYPFLLNTGRLAHQWHTMTKTGKVAKLNKLDPGPFVEIHPDDAARLGIVDQDAIEVASRAAVALCFRLLSPTECVRGTALPHFTGTTPSVNICPSTPSPTTPSTLPRSNRSSKPALSL